MTPQVAGRKTLCVTCVTKKVIYHHAVKMSKTFAQSTKRKVRAQEKEKTKSKEKEKVIAEQIRLIKMKLIKHVNNVVSITNTGNRVRFRTLSSQR